MTPDYIAIVGEASLHLTEWDKARIDLTVAKENGIDVVVAFQNEYEDVSDFEQKNGVNLPDDIAEMLTP